MRIIHWENDCMLLDEKWIQSIPELVEYHKKRREAVEKASTVSHDEAMEQILKYSPEPRLNPFHKEK